MNLQPRTLLSSLLLAACAVGHVHGQAKSTKLIDDFSDGNDDGWTQVDLLQAFGLGKGVFDASSNSYVISSADPVPQLPLGAGCVGVGSFWLSSTNGAQDVHRFSNGTVRATIQLNNELSSSFISLRSDAETVTLYDFAAANSDDEIVIDYVLNGVSQTDRVGLARAPFDFDLGQEYVMEATAVGPHLSMKVWAVGSEEPDQPQISATDHTLTSGSIGVVSYYCDGDGGGDVLSTSFDDITFTPGNSAFGAAASSATAVPEPAGLMGMLIGIAGLGLRRRLFSS
jgi:hypothetical protein